MRKTYLYGLALLSLVSCTKDFDDMNVDKKRPTDVPGQSIFANAARNLNRQVATLNVNFNPLKLWSQYLTQTTYTDESNYDLRTRNIADREWLVMYRDVIQNLKEANNFTNSESYVLAEDIAAKKNRLAIIEIYEIYSYERLVTIFGNIPYTDAHSGTNLPGFDDAKTVYYDLIDRLNDAIANLDENAGSFDMGYDNLYEGDVSSWKKFANGLKLKMAMTISDDDAGKAGTMITEAWNNTLAAQSDVAAYGWGNTTPNTNPMYEDLVQSGRSDFVGANTIIDTMNAMMDPRRKFYFTTAPDTNVYIGGIYGASNSYGVNSHAGDILHTAEQPTILMDLAEIEFYKAEAIEKGFGSGSAEDHYNNGITASMQWWGCADDSIAAYLANPAVAYATAPGTWKQKVARQSWLASYNRGMLGWTTYRRLDAPKFNIAANSNGQPTPTRYTYPINEQTLNGANYTAAAAAIGGDLKTTKLWWDKY